MRGGGHTAFGCQVREECLDLRLAHVGWVPQTMEADERAAPMHVDLLELQAGVHQADAPAQLSSRREAFDGGSAMMLFVCIDVRWNAMAKERMNCRSWQDGRAAGKPVAAAASGA